MPALIKVFLISIVFTMSSCVSEGEVKAASIIPLSGTGMARITGDSERAHGLMRNFDQQVGISSLDGKSLFRMGWDTDFPESLLITPGKHQIGVRYMYMNAYANGTIWLDAEAEKSYIIRKKAHNYSVSFWAEESDTGKRVGSVFGEEKKEDIEK